MTLDTRGVITVQDSGGMRLLTLNRPDALNAFNQDLWYASRDAFVEAAEDPDIKCVVLTGAGRAFSAGQDLNEMANPGNNFADEEPGYRAFMPVVEAFPKPLIAAVNGVGVGIGLTVLPHCDIVIFGESGRVKAPFVSLGVTTEGSASIMLPARVGWQEAAHILFTEPWVDAQRAVEIGLAWKVVPDADLLDVATELGHQIGKMPLDPLVATKTLMLAGRLDDVRAARQREDAEFAKLIGNQANQDYLENFLK